MKQRIRYVAVSLSDFRVVLFYSILYLTLLAALVFLPPMTLLERLRILNSGLCGQMGSHTFLMGGERLPLCARNTGIYLGYSTSLIVMHITGRGRAQRFPPRAICIAFIGLVAIMAFDGFNSLFVDLRLPYLYRPQNSLRLITGLGTGLAMATLLHPFLNRLLWCEYNEISSCPDRRYVLVYSSHLLLCLIAVLTQSSFLLYPLALLSTSGLIAAITSVNLILLITLWQREENIATYRELFPFLTAAILCAIVELLVLAFLKHWLLSLISSPVLEGIMNILPSLP